MKPILSIIIPCYNCEKTLEEAVNSCFTQEIKGSFEIVMVDDGSTDGTREVMKNLSENHKEIKLFYHKENMGGGATRNAAVGYSESEIIFCLDSDDILPPATLPKMLNLLLEKQCDGVVFKETHFFETNTRKVEISANNIENGKQITLLDLFKKRGFLTQVNFLYKKEAFLKAGKYPENHGFDTQDFGFRFLAGEQKAYVCPGTHYFHRRSQKQKSYFERVYEKGELSRNIYLIYENIVDFLPDSVVKKIMEYNIFRETKLGNGNLQAEIEELLKNETELTKKYITNDNDMHNTSVVDKFRLAIKNYKNTDYSKSMDIYKEILSTGFTSPVIFFNIIRCSLAIAGTPLSKIEKETEKTISELITEKPKKSSFMRRAYGYVRRLLRI